MPLASALTSIVPRRARPEAITPKERKSWAGCGAHSVQLGQLSGASTQPPCVLFFGNGCTSLAAHRGELAWLDRSGQPRQGHGTREASAGEGPRSERRSDGGPTLLGAHAERRFMKPRGRRTPAVPRTAAQRGPTVRYRLTVFTSLAAPKLTRTCCPELTITR